MANHLTYIFTAQTFDEGAAPATPAAGSVVIYAKADGLLYSKDDAGTETLVSGGAGGLTDHNHTTGGDGGDLDSPVIDGFAIFNEEAAPSTPSAGTVAIYAKPDGRIYSKDDAGVEFGPFDAAGAGARNYLAPAGFPMIDTEAVDQETANTTSHVVTLPSGIVSGDLLILIMALDGTPTISATGWTSVTTASNTVAIGVLYRIADGSEGATVTVTSTASEKSETWVGKFSDHHASAAPEGTSTGTGTASQSPNPPSVTASWGADDNTFITVAAWDLSSSAAIAISRQPWDYVSVHTRTTAATDGVGLALAIGYFATATQDTAEFGIDASEQWTTATVVVRPA